MTTALDVVKGALGLLAVLEAGESPSAEDGVDGLAMLNAMMRGFPADGIDYAHTEMETLATPVPMPSECEMHLQFMLAVYWSPKFGRTPSPVVISRADSGRRYLQARYKSRGPARTEAGTGPRRIDGGSYDDWARN